MPSTVVTAENLTTLAKVRTMLGIPTAVTTDDLYLEDLIAAATFSIQEHCGRKMGLRNYNDGADDHTDTSIDDEPRITFSGKNSRRHCLPVYPIVSAGFVLEELATRDGTGDTWTVLTSGVDYVVDYTLGIITKLVGQFNRGDRNYRVTCAAGYNVQGVAPWVPYDLEHCCKVMVREAYKEIDRTTSEKVGDIARSYDMTICRKMVEDVLENYRADSNFM